MANDNAVDVTNDDRPIALRRSRRSSVGIAAARKSSQNIVSRHGISTPPSTPRWTKKRVRFSDPGPDLQIESASSGMTPFIRRVSISAIPATNRRHSTPSRLSNRSDYDVTPISGTLQFAPLRQVLDGRVKRRLRRHRLSEEVNTIEWEKKTEARKRKSEVTRLKEELAAKDLEVQSMRDDHDIASQLEGERGGSITTNQTLSTKVQELEQEIDDLKAKLLSRESESPEDIDWDMAARDPYNANSDDDDNDNMDTTNYDDDFTMNDEIMTTPIRLNTSFPSPPSTMPNTPCRPTAAIDSGIQASPPVHDPENEQLKSHLQALNSEMDKLKAAIAFNTDHQDRLTAKLTDFISTSFSESHNTTSDHVNLDAALDKVLTALALSQSSSLEHKTAFSALSTEISGLGFGISSPDSILELIATQFRQARLDLESICPGETSFGFENSKLLPLLIERIKALTQKVQENDSSIDQYHEQEILLRQQLGARVDSMDDLREQLSLADGVISALRDESGDKETDNSRLREALEGYRAEVKGLEDLIERIEREAVLTEGSKNSEILDLDQRLQFELLRNETLIEDNEGINSLMVELQRRLAAALSSSTELQSRLDELTSSTTASLAEKDIQIADQGIKIVELNQKVTEQNQAHGVALSHRDTKISELRKEIERLNNALKSAHATILTLRGENHGLNFELRVEREKGEEAVKAVLGIMGYSGSQAEGRTSAAGPSEMSSPVKGGLMTPASGSEGMVVMRRNGGMFDGGLARRGSGRKRRRYDSGLGFLSEGEEEGFSSDL